MQLVSKYVSFYLVTFQDRMMVQNNCECEIISDHKLSLSFSIRMYIVYIHEMKSLTEIVKQKIQFPGISFSCLKFVYHIICAIQVSIKTHDSIKLAQNQRAWLKTCFKHVSTERANTNLQLFKNNFSTLRKIDGRHDGVQL